MRDYLNDQSLPSRIFASAGQLSVAIMLLGPGTTYAQSVGASPTSTESSESPDVGEITVTARRTSEKLSRVPVSVAAFGGEELAKRTVTSEQDLTQLVPGLTVKQAQTGNQLNISLRGQTLDAFSGTQPGVLPYLNEIPFASQTASSFYDLASIQALKGPQGTLFGRNATGGAVLYQTTQPKDEFGGYVDVRVGNYDLRQIQAAIDLPIVPGKVALRLAGDTMAQNGYVRNIMAGGRLGDVNNKSGRATLVITPDDALKNVTVVQYGVYRGTELQGGLTTFYGVGQTNNGYALTDSLAALYGPGSPGEAIAEDLWPGGIHAYLEWQKNNPYKIALPYQLPHYARSLYTANTTSFEVAPNLTVKNIFGYLDTYSRTPYVFAGSPFGLLNEYIGSPPGGVTFDQKQWSEEFSASGKAMDEQLQYIVGVFFSGRKETQYVPFTLGADFPTPLSEFCYCFTSKSTTKAIYGQVTYDLSSLVQGLGVTAGGRWTWEDTSLTSNKGNLYAFPRLKQSEDAPSWTLGLQYQATPESLLYVAYRGSWRAGNFNGYTTPQLSRFTKEKTWDIEAGYKFAGTLLGRRARLNLAVYRQTSTDVQRSVYLLVNDTPASFTANVPEALVKGIEVDGEVSLLSWLQLGGSFAHTDAKYTKAVVDLNGSTLPFSTFPDTPRFNGSLYAEATLPTPQEWGPVTLRAEGYGQTSQYFGSLGDSINPDVRIPGYALLNMRLDWRDIFGSGSSLGFFAKNVTDRFYYQSGYPLGVAIGLNNRTAGSPRTFGVEWRHRF